MTLLKWLFRHIKILCHANAMEYKVINTIQQGKKKKRYKHYFSQFPTHCFVALSSSHFAHAHFGEMFKLNVNFTILYTIDALVHSTRMFLWLFGEVVLTTVYYDLHQEYN